MTPVDFPDPRSCRFDLVALGSVRSGGLPLSREEVPEHVHWTQFGATWEPDVLMTAYRLGMFPMPYGAPGLQDAISWWCPDPRAAFVPHAIRCSRSLARSMRRFTVTVDTAFTEVIRNCGNPARPSGWIDEHVVAAFCTLHELGLAHSVEVWLKDELVGGLYGVDIGGVFAGESMFHTQPDASKTALVWLGRILDDGTGRLIDTQWMTDHLASMGAMQVSKQDYLDVLSVLRDRPAPHWTTRAAAVGL